MKAEDRLSKTITLKMRVDILVGIYDFLDFQEYDTTTMSFPRAINMFCRGMVQAARQNGEIPARSDQDLEEVLASYRGEQEEDPKRRTAFSLIEDEPDESPSLDEALSDVLSEGKFDDSGVHLKEAEPDNTPTQAQEERSTPPWERTEMYDGPLDWETLSERYSQEECEQDQAYEYALRVIVAQIPEYLWTSLGTKGFFDSLHKEYRKWMQFNSLDEQDQK